MFVRVPAWIHTEIYMLSGNKSINVSSYEPSQSDEIRQLPKVYSSVFMYFSCSL